MNNSNKQKINEHKNRFINRELSWLKFNERVLSEANNLENPLYERAKFLSIAGSNLDEFFMVRVAGLHSQIKQKVASLSSDGLSPEEQMKSVILKTKVLLQIQNEVFSKLIEELKLNNIELTVPEKLNQQEKKRLLKIFNENIYPLLTPSAIDPAHPFPFIFNKGRALVLNMTKKNKNRKLNSIILVPQSLPRFVEISTSNNFKKFLVIDDVISFFSSEIFPDYLLEAKMIFRVIRDSDVEIQEESEDLVRSFEIALKQRRVGDIVRLEILENSDQKLINFITDKLNINSDYIYKINALVGIQDIDQICLIKKKKFIFDIFTPRKVERLIEFNNNFFDTIKKKDLIVHHPFETFDAVIEFLNQAAYDPQVVAIKQTLYRTTLDSPIVKALIVAAENGKVVTAVVEIKARFDEVSNIELSRRLEKAGVQIVYGFAKFKTHAKSSLVLRKEGTKIQSYFHLGTGNYHPVNAKIYTDLSFFSADKNIAADVEKFFNYVTGYAKPKKLNKISIAPINLRDTIESRIDIEIKNSKKKKPSGIWFKMNSLVDPNIIDKLYEASQAGVKVFLSVRGVCCLKPGVKNLSENIVVKSIIGRFLEHSRIYCFANGHSIPSRKSKVYISSADMMPRNLNRRIELLIPIENKTVHEQVLDQVMLANYIDTVQSWILKDNGNYEKMNYVKADSFSAHKYFMKNPSLSGRGKAKIKFKPKKLNFKIFNYGN
ncbi:MAG: RNA degradosome polyphosphate kinase [Pelagibacteraceae bacterium]|nr:RNA degradosome polyphosphate kinase [Pelagibacteraceae bacterium]PHX88652.1 MAG: RNA degradosome polyphosphate kinase [Pelagibacteraceae bacterium]